MLDAALADDRENSQSSASTEEGPAQAQEEQQQQQAEEELDRDDGGEPDTTAKHWKGRHCHDMSLTSLAALLPPVSSTSSSLSCLLRV